VTHCLDAGLFAIHKSAIQQGRRPGGMSAQIATILVGWQGAATPPNVISAFEQTRLDSIWDRGRRAVVMSVDLINSIGNRDRPMKSRNPMGDRFNDSHIFPLRAFNDRD
jgi:hypothetical protein